MLSSIGRTFCIQGSIITMKSKIGISRQLIIALSFVNLSVTACSFFFGYLIYSFAVITGSLSLESLSEEWTDFHFIDWIWLFAVIFCGTVISLIIGIFLAKRFINPISFIAEAAKKISQGDLTARVQDTYVHSLEISELMDNFNDMAQKLEVAVENTQIWNAAIAHELRTPITILQGRLQGIVDGIFEPNEKLIKSLLNQVEGLSYLVEDLRALSLFENKKLNLNKNLIDFSLSIEKVILIFSEKLERAKFTIQLDLANDFIYCDKQRMEQVLIALIDNAINYSDPGILNISCKIIEQKWILELKDEGPGIPLQYQNDLFNPFFRVEESHNNELGGTGLGLSVVMAIIDAHGGQINYSNINGNSIFTITLPNSP